MRDLHHLEFSSDAPGIVSVKQVLHGEEKAQSILSTSVEAILAAGLPRGIPPAGMSVDRQTYLYKNVRQHVAAPFQDVLCPKPVTVRVNQSLSE